jgi:hypothetical protein
MGISAIHSKPADGVGGKAVDNPQPGGGVANAAPSEALCQQLMDFLDRHRRAILLTVAAVYLLGFNGQWLLQPDSALYLCLARNLARGWGYTFGGVLHDTACPGVPMALAALYRVFPDHIVLAADVMMWVCGVAALGLVYRLVLLAYDRKTALLVTCAVAITTEFYRYAFSILTDMPFLTGVMAVLAGHEGVFHSSASRRARWWDWALLIGGLIVLITTRPLMIAFLAAWFVSLGFAAVVRRNLKAAGAIALCAGILVVFFVFDPRRRGHGLVSGYLQYAVHQLTHFDDLRTAIELNFGRLLNPLIAKAAFGLRLGGWWWPNAIFGFCIIAAAVALIRKRMLWGLWVIALVATLLMTVSDDRYFLPILPLIVLGWWDAIRRFNLRFPTAVGNWIFAFLVVLGTVPNAVLLGGFVIHQRWIPFINGYQNGKFAPVVQMAEQIPAQTTQEDVILCPEKLARIMAFLSDRMFYEFNEPIKAKNGHMLVILDPADIEYKRWLKRAQVHAYGDPLITVNRGPNLPPLTLERARFALPDDERTHDVPIGP